MMILYVIQKNFFSSTKTRATRQRLRYIRVQQEPPHTKHYIDEKANDDPHLHALPVFTVVSPKVTID
jgi:hypothetical protein